MLNRIKNYIPKEIEEKVLKFWEERKIFEKSVKKKAPKGDYVFYDGPPFATGLPHYGHILANIIKDVIPRYQTMKGHRVERRWGWDCHGLPIENVIEQELGLKTKKDIEKIGIGKFNEAAHERVLSFAGDWKKIIPKIGRWVDMENDYKTMDSDYTESVLWVFKKLFDKGLVYEGYKSMHICPRCETTLSNFEVTQNYKELDDISVFIKVKLKPNQPIGNVMSGNKTYLLVWTTTPWTLPGNVALAVNPKLEYRKVKVKDEFFIVASELLAKVFPLEGETTLIGSPIKGKDLIGKKYKPFFDYYAKDKNIKNHKNGWKVYGADFVTAEEGTGIVHIAPAFGEDDMNLAQKENLPFVQHVTMDGKFKPEVKDFAGMPVKPKENSQKTDVEILKWLSRNDRLFSKQKITHSYPFCWRCDTPLLNYATSSWFVKVTAIKKGKNGIVENNKKINWVPSYVGEGRFNNWLEDARDWSISRSRFWGAPIPIWRCEKCEKIKVIGSIKDIKDNAEKSGNKYYMVRHGESENNAKNIINSNIKHNHFHLTEKGRKQVLALAKKCGNKKIDVIFSSDFERTKETADLIAKEIGLPKSKIIFNKRIREVNTGIFDGKNPLNYHDYFTSLEEKFYKVPPEGENLTELKNRMADFLYDIDAKYNNKNILIVSHEYPLWQMTAAAQGANVKKTLALKNSRKDFMKTAEIRELEFVPLPHNENFELDFHRPYIDGIEFKCGKCKGIMKRVSDVFDCWFESGSMPYSQVHYPFENKKKFEKNFPAKFIAEGIDQTRGWFYTLLVLSTGLFGKPAYKNVVVNGIVLAEDGQKMSKRLKNYPDPTDIISKYGADAMRLYLLSSPAVRGENLNFSEKGVDELYKKTILRLWNVYNFYNTYADKKFKNNKIPKSKNILDKWIVARLNQLILEVSKAMDEYELDRAAKPLSEFVDDFSTWYLRRSRRRLQKPENKKDLSVASQTLGYVLFEFGKIAAPFIPFVADALYKSFSGDSVHLQNWPIVDKKAIDKKLLEAMKEIRNFANLALAKRAELGIKVRQPLSELRIKNKELRTKKELLNILADEVNVKNVVWDNKISGEIELNSIITPELKSEGLLREFTRMIQDLRQDAGYHPKDRMELFVEAPAEIEALLRNFEKTFKKEIGAKSIGFKKTDKFDAEIQTRFENQPIWLAVKKSK